MIGVILAGGKSSRIGMDKLLLPVHGRPMIEHILSVLDEVFEQIIVVGKPSTYLECLGPLVVVEDKIRGIGPMGGVYTGLQYMEAEYGFFVACDMPFLDASIIRQQVRWAQKGIWDAVVPRYNQLLEPLHGVYSKRCLKPVSILIRQGDYRIRRLYDLVNVRYLDIESEKVFRRAFYNINTVETWQEIEGNASELDPIRPPL